MFQPFPKKHFYYANYHSTTLLNNSHEHTGIQKVGTNRSSHTDIRVWKKTKCITLDMDCSVPISLCSGAFQSLLNKITVGGKKCVFNFHIHFLFYFLLA